jgi:protoporphyrin/coproporphyrin ferrochelatase
MTPREFLRRYNYENYSQDRRIVDGSFFSSDALDVEPGDTVGVVLLNLGGPDSQDTVRPFLYNLFMDPAIIDIPLPGLLRHWVCRLISKLRAPAVAEDYDEIDTTGGSPINRLTEEQSDNLETLLNEKHGSQTGATFRTYIAMRYWKPFSEDTARQMEEDGVDKVVLLPLYPQYSKTTTGASLSYWKELEKAGEIPEWPTSYVFEYAAYPKYVEAISERIDEGLQKFPEEVRDDVHLLFSAHGTPVKEMKQRRDPYCCLVHSTVKHVMEHRQHDRDFTTAFQSKVGPAEWLTPGTPDEITRLHEEEGKDAMLVIPVAFVTEHIETSYELAIEIPEDLEEDEGIHIPHYHVMPALNSHPKFIETLADVTIAQLGVSDSPAPWSTRPCYKAKNRDTRCHQCERIAEARNWTTDTESPKPRETATA